MSSPVTKRYCKRMQQNYFSTYRKMLSFPAVTYIVCILVALLLKRAKFFVSGPYFTWSTKLDHEHICSGNSAEQSEIPRLVFDIQDILLHYMQAYGEVNDANINHIMIQAWATPGSRRVSQKRHSMLYFPKSD
jgi:hypothetical protein